MSGANKKKISITYEKSPDCKSVAATGIYGGPNPQGEIICNFYLEEQALPKGYLIVDETTGEVIKEEIDSFVEARREVQVTVVLRHDIAKKIGQWMIEKADMLASEGFK